VLRGVVQLAAMASSRPATTERREAYYSGNVQGVGFRYTVRELAEGLAVAGYVRNLPDGRVHLVVEGAAAELQRLQDAIAQRMADHIRNVAVDVRPAIGEFKRFEIRH
jgi:acylphosphatase